MSAPDFDLRDVLAFVRSKPSDERYDYIGFFGPCALEQFLVETGRCTIHRVSPSRWFDGCVWHRLDPRLDQAAVSYPHTFGALADRLEALLPQNQWVKPETYLGDYALLPLRAKPASRLGADAQLPLSQEVSL